jgi:hypothetical protein
MSNLFGDSTPLRLVLHVNVWPGHHRFDWDGLAQNPETGDVYAITASPGRLRSSLGPELAKALLWSQAQVAEAEAVARKGLFDRPGPGPVPPSSGIRSE